MSTRYEGASTGDTVSVVPGGTTIGEDVMSGPTLVISYDEVFYIEGSSRQDLRDWLAGALKAVDELPCEALPPTVEIRARDLEVGDHVFDYNDDDDGYVVDRFAHEGDLVITVDTDGGEHDYDGDSAVQIRKAITVTWHQPQIEPFDDAEFYEPGRVVTVTGRDGYTIDVSNEGDRCWDHAADGVTLTRASQFRERFPDGATPEDGADGWLVLHNGWFDLYDGRGDHVDDAVCHSLAEALNDAIGRVKQHLGGPDQW